MIEERNDMPGDIQLWAVRLLTMILFAIVLWTVTRSYSVNPAFGCGDCSRNGQMEMECW